MERTGALLAGSLMLVMTLVMLRRGAFTPRLVVELRHAQRVGDQAMVAVVAGGQPMAAEVQLHYADGEERRQAAVVEVPRFAALRAVTVHLPTTTARQVKVWAHAVTAEGQSESLAGRLDIHTVAESKQFDLKLCGGQVVVPHSDGVGWLTITRQEAATS